VIFYHSIVALSRNGWRLGWADICLELEDALEDGLEKTNNHEIPYGFGGVLVLKGRTLTKAVHNI
jgi:hypothetical protein